MPKRPPAPKVKVQVPRPKQQLRVAAKGFRQRKKEGYS